jgi:hypothetical protein
LLGWLGKALLFRDVYLCWIMSILFEILEMTFEHMLPNFKECWWDHVRNALPKNINVTYKVNFGYSRLQLDWIHSRSLGGKIFQHESK